MKKSLALLLALALIFAFPVTASLRKQPKRVFL